MKKNKILVSQYLSLIIALIAVFSILGYAYAVKEFFGILVYLPMSVHTAMNFFMFAITVLLYTCDVCLMKEIMSPYSGGITGRILIPFSILVPTFLGYICLFLYGQFFFSIEFGVAVLILVVIMVFILLIWHVVVLLNKKDRLQQITDGKLRKAYNLLKSSIDSYKDVIIFSINKDYQFINFNDAFKTLPFLLMANMWSLVGQ